MPNTFRLGLPYGNPVNIPRSISLPRKTSSLLHQVKARNNYYEYSSFNKPTTQNKFAVTPSKSTQ